MKDYDIGRGGGVVNENLYSTNSKFVRQGGLLRISAVTSEIQRIPLFLYDRVMALYVVHANNIFKILNKINYVYTILAWSCGNEMVFNYNK